MVFLGSTMLNGWDGVLGIFFFQTWQVEWIPQHFFPTLLWIIQVLICKLQMGLSMCLLEVRVPCEHYMISVLYDILLLMIILVTVVPATLRSSTCSSCVVLGCSLTFLIIRFTPRWEILRGAPDRERLIVNWCFFHFLIIAPTVDSFLPSCLSIVLVPISVLCRYTILSRMYLDNSLILPIVEIFDSDSMKDSVN